MPPKEDSTNGVLIDPIQSRTAPPVEESNTTTSQEQSSSSSSSSPPQKSTAPTRLLSDVAMAKSKEQLQQKQKQEQSQELDDNLWWIHGNGYNLETFVDRHPGGREAILLGKGRDCTALVESYHAFSSQHGKVLEKYLKQEGNQPRSADIFYDVLKKRVAATLKSKGFDPIQDRGASWGRSLYYLLIFLAFLATGYSHVQGSVWGSFGFAIFGWLMGALGHDAGHFAASHDYPVINEWGVWAMSLICNPILWQHQHTYGHHSFTNEFSHDPDLHHFHLLLRVHQKIPHESIFQYQKHLLYVGFAYLFVVFGTCFYIPMKMMQSGTLYGIVHWQDQDRPTKKWGMRLHMLLYVGIVIMAPFWSHRSAWTAFGSVALHVSTLGVTFAIFSQVNHLNEASLEGDMETRREDNPSKRRDPGLINSWAAAQVETSNNFASQSWLWHILSNGLNHQIEHHLFPGLNHGHLYHISPVVRQTCEEYGVQYKSYDTWGDIMSATLRWYECLSADETIAMSQE